jgi:hypothetical protein
VQSHLKQFIFTADQYWCVAREVVMRIVVVVFFLFFWTGCDKLGFRFISESEYHKLKTSQESGFNKPRYLGGMDGNNEFLEYYAWEETKAGRTREHRGFFKQVKKIYPMNNKACTSVVTVLSEMPQFTTGNDFYCFPAHINPNEYFSHYSAMSDLPDK